MLENWLSPTQNVPILDESTIGSRIKTSIGEAEESQKRIFIVSDGSNFANNAKSELYNLKDHFQQINLYDLGSLKNKSPEFIIPAISQLIQDKARIVLLSKEQSYFDSVFRALEANFDHISLAYMSSKLDQILADRTSRSLSSNNLLNLAVIGFQRHFCSKEVINYLHESFVNHLSYGQLSQNISLAEPILRSVHAATIDTAILRGSNNAMPNGLDALEICQLAKYCGMSSTLRVMGISNKYGPEDVNIAALVSQMMWYFIEGTMASEVENKFGPGAYFQEHLVQTDYSKHSFTFWKSSKTGRWWFEIPDADGNRGNIYPCNQEDYDLACRNEISAYLLNQLNLDH